MQFKESQRYKDQTYANALRNSTFRRLRDREEEAKIKRTIDAIEGVNKQRAASQKGRVARMIWATANQHRLIRVFA